MIYKRTFGKMWMIPVAEYFLNKGYDVLITPYGVEDTVPCRQIIVSGVTKEDMDEYEMYIKNIIEKLKHK